MRHLVTTLTIIVSMFVISCQDTVAPKANPTAEQLKQKYETQSQELTAPSTETMKNKLPQTYPLYVPESDNPTVVTPYMFLVPVQPHTPPKDGFNSPLFKK